MTTVCVDGTGSTYQAWRRRLASDLTGNVLEIGAGRGENGGLLPPGTTWIAVEPDHRRAAAARTAARAISGGGVVLECSAEDVPLPDDSVDAVLATLVLCSVSDQHRALAEVRRVLRPGGRFRFLDHVASPRGTWTRRAQRIVTPWSVVFDHGCHPARDTEATLRAVGFAHLDIKRFSMPGPLGSRIEHIAGEARVA